MKLLTKQQLLTLALFSFTLPASAIVFNIDFRNGEWTQNGTTTTGWPNSAITTPTNTVPPTSASTVLDASSGLNVTVSSSFFGTALKGPNNLKLDPPNTAGFTFQNKGTGDLNTGTTLNNYQRIDFTFSNTVKLNSLQLEDIDRSSSATNPQWIDATTIELWTSTPTAFGAGINPLISVASTTNLTVVNADTSRFGTPYVYASTEGNTINSDTRSIADFSSDAEVKGFSIFFWNQQNATGGQHGISLRATGSEIAAVPEPASYAMALGLVVGFVVIRRRFRKNT